MKKFQHIMSENELQAIISTLDLEPHPEGGYYKETYRSNEMVQRDDGSRRASGTGIYFLLPAGVCTSWHCVNSDELWHFYRGDELVLEIVDRNGAYHKYRLDDTTVDEKTVHHALVPAGCWQRSYSTGRYSLVGCTVSPGFEFDDFEMIETEELASEYPDLVSRITRNPFE